MGFGDFAPIIAVSTLLAGLIAAFFQRAKRWDELNSEYEGLHTQFWSDKDFIFVRSLLANRNQYELIKSVFYRRMADPDSIKVEEYENIDKIDKFMNFILRVDAIGSRFSHGNVVSRIEPFMESIFLTYWLRQIVENKRIELYIYVVCFYYIIGVKPGQVSTRARESSLKFLRTNLKIDRDLFNREEIIEIKTRLVDYGKVYSKLDESRIVALCKQLDIYDSA